MLPPRSWLFCLLMVLAMVSTDDTRSQRGDHAHAGRRAAAPQDVVLPRPHVLALRLGSVGIGVFFFWGSFSGAARLLQPVRTMMTSMWMGGAAP
jgi:hypothetical protein